MSVLTCGERYGARDCEESDDGSRTYRRLYLLTVSSVHDGADVVLSDPRLPQLFDRYQTQTETNPFARVKSRRPKQIGPKQWEVELEYNSKMEGGQAPDYDKTIDPIEGFPPKVSLTFEKQQLPCGGELKQLSENPAPDGSNIFGHGILSSAEEPFDPPPMMDRSMPVLTIEVARKSLDPRQILDYVDAINLDPFWGAAPRQFKIDSISCPGRAYHEANKTKTLYFPVTCVLKFKRETWTLRILDRGTFYKSGGSKLAFMSKEGQPYVGLLDGAGGALAANADPFYLSFSVYLALSFGPLDLPQGF